jgi:hypothetical protein
MTTILGLLFALAYWFGGRALARKISATTEGEPCESCYSGQCSCVDA